MALTETRLDKIIGIGSGTGSRPAFGQSGARWIDTTGPTETYDSGTAWVALGGAGGGSLFNYVCVEERQTSGTSAGASVAGGLWRTRVLTTITADSAAIASLASNQITLPTGTYRVHGSSPFVQVNNFQVRLQNITAGTTLVLGSSEYCGTATAGQTRAHLQGRFTLAASSALEFQYQCASAVAGNGLGLATSFTGTTEVYSSIEFWKE